jgi:predicted Fe-Mo cluster-binding NifX family protein
MKIVVASSDGANTSSHFGRRSCFLIFEIVDGKIIGKEVRSNTFTAHARGECSREHHHEHGEHSHASVVEALSDCNVVLSYGMGWRATEGLNEGGVQNYVMDERCTPDDAIALFLERKLPSASRPFCRCRQ